MLNNELPLIEELYAQLKLTVSCAWQNKLSRWDIDEWLSNFKGEIFTKEKEQHLALILLNNFVFYNQEEVKHLCKVIYKELFHYLFKTENIKDKDPREVYKELLKSLRFCYFGRPNESGSLISYYFGHVNSLSKEHFMEIEKAIESGISKIVVVDDVTLTGEQFIMYLDQKKIADKKIEIYFLTFFSTPEATKLLEKRIKKVLTANLLDERNKCFSNESLVFYGIDHIKNDCKQLALHYGKKIHKWPLGFGDGQYAFGFFYNIPDNSLPIFWVDDENWRPIFKRDDKKYQLKDSRENYEEFGTYL